MKFSQTLIDQLRQAQQVTILTGAGVSAESGVATFRDALTGLWSNFDPELLGSAEGFSNNPPFVWGWYEARRHSILNTEPNPAHRAIAALAKPVAKTHIVKNLRAF